MSTSQFVLKEDRKHSLLAVPLPTPHSHIDLLVRNKTHNETPSAGASNILLFTNLLCTTTVLRFAMINVDAAVLLAAVLSKRRY